MVVSDMQEEAEFVADSTDGGNSEISAWTAAEPTPENDSFMSFRTEGWGGSLDVIPDGV
jgi:hypothetical protein